MLPKKIFKAFTGREKVIFIASGVVGVVSLFILSGILIAQVTTIVPATGGEFSEGIIGQPVYVNPVLASSETDRGLVRLIFSNLADVSDKVEASQDGRTWKIRLKENLRWQDGEKLTSDDVIFTIEKIQDQDANSPLAASWQGVAPSRISELELQLSLINPYAFFEDNIRGLYIIPKHLFADIPVANWKLSDYNLKPVGSGPYKFISYEQQRGGFITAYHLVANDHYFGDRALLENFDFEFFAKKDDLLQNFNAGQVDGIADLEPEDLQRIKRPYETFPFHLINYYAAFLNQNKSLPLKDLAVRKALSEAAAREDIIEQVLGGRGKPEYGPIPEGAPFYNPAIEKTTSSIDFASSTLDAAGWKMGPDGFRQKQISNSVIRLEVALTVPQINFLEKTAALLKTSWERAGIKTNIAALPIEDINSNAIKNRDYEVLLFGNLLNLNSDLYLFWDSAQRFYPGGNLSIYENKRVDALIDSIPQNLDANSREGQFNELQNDIVRDYPAVFLYSPDYMYITGKNIKGVNPTLIEEPADRFRDAPHWYVKTARVLK